MDKNSIIAKVTRDSEDKLLLARVLDKYEQMCYNVENEPGGDFYGRTEYSH